MGENILKRFSRNLEKVALEVLWNVEEEEEDWNHFISSQILI
jgi:hypothetical protein